MLNQLATIFTVASFYKVNKMSNKSAGQRLKNMEFTAYTEAMGGSVTDLLNKRDYSTGSSFTNRDVYKYYKILRQFALNRYRWVSPQINEYELRLIEWNIFNFGRCAMLKPKIYLKNKVKIIFPEYRIFQCVFTDINYRDHRPRKINIINNTQSRFNIEPVYNYDEFVIFTDEFLLAIEPNPFSYVAWEFANKLHELDLAFKANSNKLRFPMVFNDASLVSKDNNLGLPNSEKSKIAEFMRSAMGRNEAFVSIPENYVGANNFMHEPTNNQNHLLDLIEAQKRLYQSYLERLGLYTQRDKGGVYTVKSLQETGDESPEFITTNDLNNRGLCAKEACKKFNIDIKVEAI